MISAAKQKSAFVPVLRPHDSPSPLATTTGNLGTTIMQGMWQHCVEHDKLVYLQLY